VAFEFGSKHFMQDQSEQANAVSYAKVLIQIGMYNLAIQELQ